MFSGDEFYDDDITSGPIENWDDEDDFLADRVAELVASGVPRSNAIRRVAYGEGIDIETVAAVVRDRGE